MANEFFTWGNFFVWAVCSVLIYLSLNFRLYMIFHHPGRKLKAKAKARKSSAIDQLSMKPGAQTPVWDRSCLQHNTCFVGNDSFPDQGPGKH